MEGPKIPLDKSLRTIPLNVPVSSRSSISQKADHIDSHPGDYLHVPSHLKGGHTFFLT